MRVDRQTDIHTHRNTSRPSRCEVYTERSCRRTNACGWWPTTYCWGVRGREYARWHYYRTTASSSSSSSSTSPWKAVQTSGILSGSLESSWSQRAISVTSVPVHCNKRRLLLAAVSFCAMLSSQETRKLRSIEHHAHTDRVTYCISTLTSIFEDWHCPLTLTFSPKRVMVMSHIRIKAIKRSRVKGHSVQKLWWKRTDRRRRLH